MFGIFAKGKAARLGQQIKNWLTRTDQKPASAIPQTKRAVTTQDTTATRTSLRVVQVKHKNDKRMPLGTRMLKCRQGYFMKKEGYTAFSGPCPSKYGAQKTALKNMGVL